MSMIGKTLGSYTIEEQLGSGGMARVYRGRHVHLERDVAIKVMHAHLSDQEGLRDRFLNEARANAGLKHNGIVQIYDFDLDDGVCYIAMEMLDGQSLEERAHELAAGGSARFELAEALDIVRAIGEALAYAHGQGVVHRDIKPSNIMITRDGRAVLTDFGLAAVLDQTRLTTDGTSAGTPSYMSPEQASGQRGDHRADIYSLGVVLYQLLAGELPLQSETLVGMINKLLNEPAPALSDKAPGTPEHIVNAVQRALQKDPERRFASVDAMLGELSGKGATVGGHPAAAANAAGQAVAADSTRARHDGGASGGPGSSPGVPLQVAHPATAASSMRRWLLAAPAVVALLAIGFWAMQGGTSPEASNRGSDIDSALNQVESMVAEVESMVPTVDSMVPEGEADVDSMAAMMGWTDGFDDNSHGWETSDAPIARALVDGEYEIDLALGGQAVSAVAEGGGEFMNFEYHARGSLLEGQVESGYGLVFRRVDARNYYVFAINGMGQWSIWALEDGTWRELRGLPSPWTPSSAVDTGGFNDLVVTVTGEQITAGVNGQELVTLADSTFAKGAVGFYAASSRTAADAHTRVRFDDVEVKVLQ